MQEPSLNLLVLANDGDDYRRLREALDMLPIGEFRQVESWDLFMLEMIRETPDVAVISYATLAAAGVGALKSANWALREVQVPTLVALPADLARDRVRIEAARGFSAIVEEPYRYTDIAEAIRESTGNLAWAPEAVSGPEDDKPAGASAHDLEAALDAEGTFDGVGDANAATFLLGGAAGPPEKALDDTIPPGAYTLDGTAAAAALSSDSGSEVAFSFDADPSLRFSDEGSGAQPVADEPDDPPYDDSEEDESGSSPFDDMEDSLSAGMHHVDLPMLVSGSLDDASLIQVMFGLFLTGATGILRIQQQNLAREVMFNRGIPGVKGRAPSGSDEQKVTGAFGWKRGTYTFRPDSSARVQFFGFKDVFQLLQQGVHQHMSINDAATALGPHLKQYVVKSNQVERYGASLSKLPGMSTFLSQITGQEVFERLMARAGANTESFLKDAYLLMMLGIVVFRQAPMFGMAMVEYEIPEHTPLPEPAPETRTPEPKAAQPSISAEDRETLDRLTRTLKAMRKGSPYMVFGLDKGCGLKAVEQRYYQLVREHHPDVYARAGLPKIKSAAEKIFVEIQSAHGSLLKSETTQDPVARTAGDSASSGGSSSQPGARRGGRYTRGASSRRESGANPSVSPNARQASSPSSSSRARQEGPEKAMAAAAAAARRRQAQKQAQASSQARRERPSTMNRMTPDQLFLSGVRAYQSGANEKALGMMELAVQKGYDAPISKAYLGMLRYANKKSTKEESTKLLSEAFSAMETPRDKAQVELLMGHFHRSDGNEKQAAKHYKRAAKLDANNREAARWSRHYNRKEDDKKDSGGSFLNKLFQGRGKK